MIERCSSFHSPLVGKGPIASLNQLTFLFWKLWQGSGPLDQLVPAATDADPNHGQRVRCVTAPYLPFLPSGVGVGVIEIRAIESRGFDIYL